MGNRNTKSAAQQSQGVYPFNFFAKLPDLARQNLTRQMELQDLILLSSCSKRCALAIRMSRVPSVPIRIELGSDQFCICLADFSFCWQFEFGKFKKQNFFQKIFDFQRFFKIKKIPVIIYRNGVLKTLLKKDLDEAFNTAISQILYIIPSCKFSRIYLDLSDHFPVDFHCKVALAGISQVKELCLHGYEDSSENVKYILENIHATDKIVDRFRHKDTDQIDNKLILKTPNLYFNGAEFLKPFDHFPSTFTETATFRDVQFDKKSLIDFLKWFLSIPDLSELGAKECDWKMRAQYFRRGYSFFCAGDLITVVSRRRTPDFINIEDGLGIMRSDGLLGTILEYGEAIVFVVWHESFPEQLCMEQFNHNNGIDFYSHFSNYNFTRDVQHLATSELARNVFRDRPFKPKKTVIIGFRISFRCSSAPPTQIGLSCRLPCSKRCALAIRISRVPAVSLNIELRGDSAQICRSYNSPPLWTFEFGEFNTKRTFKIKDVKVARIWNGDLRTVRNRKLDAAFNTAIAHILYIIPSCKFERLCLGNNFFAGFRCKIALAGVSQVKNMYLCDLKDRSRNIKYILENIQATELIKDDFSHKDTDKIDNKLILKTPNLYILRAQFLKPFNHFPSTYTKTAKFYKIRFDEKKLIKFVKWFKSVPAEQIRNFKGIKWHNENRSCKIPNLTELGAKECDLNLRAQYYPFGKIFCCAGDQISISPRRCTSHFIDTEYGLDIMRDGGLLGTVLEDGGAIVFLVWHERFPEQPPFNGWL